MIAALHGSYEESSDLVALDRQGRDLAPRLLLLTEAAIHDDRARTITIDEIQAAQQVVAELSALADRVAAHFPAYELRIRGESRRLANEHTYDTRRPVLGVSSAACRVAVANSADA